MREENYSSDFEVATLVAKLKEIAPKDCFVHDAVQAFLVQGSQQEVVKEVIDDWNVVTRTTSTPEDMKEETVTLASKGNFLGCGVDVDELLPNATTNPTSEGLASKIRSTYDTSASQKQQFTRIRGTHPNTVTQYGVLFNLLNTTISYKISTNRHGAVMSESLDIPILSYRENQDLHFGASVYEPEVEDWVKKESIKEFHMLDSDGKFGFGAAAVASYEVDTNNLASLRLTINYYTQNSDEHVELLYLPENNVSGLGWEAIVSTPSVSDVASQFIPPFLIFRGGAAKLEINAMSLHPAIPADLSVYFPLEIPEKLPHKVGHLEPVLQQFERYQIK